MAVATGETITARRAARSSPQSLWINLVLAAWTFVAYSQVLRHDFVRLDDQVYVTENPMVQKGLTWPGVTWAFTTFYASNWHPLTWLSHMLDVELFGMHPGGHHVTNLILHMAGVCVLFHLLCRTTGAVWRSAIVAALFSLHPLHVESVAWVAERKDVLSTLLGLLTLLTYVRHVERPSTLRYGITIALYALGLLAKPMLVTLPFVMLLMDYWPLNRMEFHRNSRAQPIRRAAGKHAQGKKFNKEPTQEIIMTTTSLPVWQLLLEKLPLLILAAASCIVTVVAQRSGGALVTQSLLPLEYRIGYAFIAYAKYLWLTVWPSGLCVYYPHSFRAPNVWQVTLAAALLMGTTAAAILVGRRHRFVPMGWFWYLGTLVPVIGIVQVGSQAMADRYTYVPLIGIFIVAVWGVAEAARTCEGRVPWIRQFIPIAQIACVLVFSLLTWRQVGFWRDSVTLFQRTLDVTKNNAPAHVFMAQTLFPLGREEESVWHYEKALALNPNDPDNLYNLGYAHLLMGKREQAIARFEQALRLRPRLEPARYQLGRALVESGRFTEALPHLTAVQQSNPQFAQIHEHLGWALFALDRYEEAIPHLDHWLKVSPDAVQSRLQLGRSLFALGDVPAAVEQLRTAVDQDPQLAAGWASLAQALTPLGRIQEAIDAYQKALNLSPDFVEAANNLARIYATYRDPQFRDGVKAVALAEEVCRKTNHENIVALDTLAAAYAEIGRFDDAVATSRKAVELAEEQNDADLVALLRSRLEMYRNQTPLREPVESADAPTRQEP